MWTIWIDAASVGDTAPVQLCATIPSRAGSLHVHVTARVDFSKEAPPLACSWRVPHVQEWATAKWGVWVWERVDTGHPAAERHAAVARFNAGGSRAHLFLLSSRAAGLGIDLPSIGAVLVLDSDWDPRCRTAHLPCAYSAPMPAHFCSSAPGAGPPPLRCLQDSSALHRGRCQACTDAGSTAGHLRETSLTWGEDGVSRRC